MLDLGQQMYTSMTYSVRYSLAANMQRAGMNTLMGIGIVFLMLLFLSFVIGLFKVHREIPECRQERSRRGSTEKQKRHLHPAIAQSEAADEDFADDLELVAVISAAIAAYRKYFRRQFLLSVQSRNQINGTEPDRRI